MGSRYHLCVILVLVLRGCPYPRSLAKVAPCGEIFMNPSDPKPVMELLKGIIGLDVVFTARGQRQVEL